MKDKEMIEKMAEILCESKEHNCNGEDCKCLKQATDLFNKGARILSEDSFVLTNDNAEEIGNLIITSPQMQFVMSNLIKAWQKETAKEILSDLWNNKFETTITIQNNCSKEDIENVGKAIITTIRNKLVELANKEILDNYKDYEVFLDDRFGVRLCQFLTVEQMKQLGFEYNNQEQAKAHKPKDWTEENILVQLKEDVEFGWEKACDERGISSSLMYEVVKSWCKVLENEFENFDEYEPYGKPLFEAVGNWLIKIKE